MVRRKYEFRQRRVTGVSTGKEIIEQTPHVCEICGCVDTQITEPNLWGGFKGEVRITKSAYFNVVTAIEKHKKHDSSDNFWKTTKTIFDKETLYISTPIGDIDEHVLTIICAFKDIDCEDSVGYYEHEGQPRKGMYILRKSGWKYIKAEVAKIKISRRGRRIIGELSGFVEEAKKKEAGNGEEENISEAHRKLIKDAEKSIEEIKKSGEECDKIMKKLVDNYFEVTTEILSEDRLIKCIERTDGKIIKVEDRKRDGSSIGEQFLDKLKCNANRTVEEWLDELKIEIEEHGGIWDGGKGGFYSLEDMLMRENSRGPHIWPNYIRAIEILVKENKEEGGIKMREKQKERG